MAGSFNRYGDPDFLFGGRLVSDGREGDVVYARTLRYYEEATGDGVHVGAGERLVIRSGGFPFDQTEFDEYYVPTGVGGYRPVDYSASTLLQMGRMGFPFPLVCSFSADRCR